MFLKLTTTISKLFFKKFRDKFQRNRESFDHRLERDKLVGELMDETLEKLTLEKRKTRQLTATNRRLVQEIEHLKLEKANREQRHDQQVTE